MSRRVIAVIDWRSSALLKENVRFLQRAGAEGRIRHRERGAGAVKYRSLTLWEDGSCELQRLSAAAVARRFRGSTENRTARKVRMSHRG